MQYLERESLAERLVRTIEHKNPCERTYLSRNRKLDYLPEMALSRVPGDDELYVSGYVLLNFLHSCPAFHFTRDIVVHCSLGPFVLLTRFSCAPVSHKMQFSFVNIVAIWDSEDLS